MTKVYAVTFADGKRATVLDMDGRPEQEAIASIKTNFQPGYVLAVEPVKRQGVEV